MNILGHAYVAVHAAPGNRSLLITGALLPESSPFIPDNPFSWKEIHEGGEKLTAFLDENYPEERDLGLGVLAHSLKYGVDGFNQEIENYIAEERKNLLRKIGVASQATQKTAETLLHNYLGGGLDYWILETFPDLVREVQETIRRVEIKTISRLLAECFGKDVKESERMVGQLFGEVFRPEDLTSLEGLTKSWLRQAAGLSDVGSVDFSKTTEIIKTGVELLKDDWQEFLELVTKRVGENLSPFRDLSHD